MPKIGIHASVWTGVLTPETLAESIRRTRAAGFDLLEIPLLNPAGFDVEGALSTLSEDPIELAGSLGLGPTTDISSDDRVRVAAGERLLRDALDVLSALGARHLVGVIYGAMTKQPAPCTPTARRAGIEALRRVADHAAQLGIELGLEIVNRYETNVMNTARHGREYLAELDRPNVRLHLDTYHMNIEEPDLISPILDSVEQLGYVHIGESNRGYLGSGTADLAGCLRALTAIRYDGPIVFESFSSAVVDPLLSNVLAVWRNLWDDADDLGAHANRYIRDGLHAAASISQH